MLEEMDMKVKITTLDNKAAGEIDLSDAIFGLEVRKDILHRIVRWQRAKAQAGTHKTSTRSEVSFTTAKMYKQKGTGNARHGAKSVSQFRKGATIFGPVVRSHAHDLTKKFRKLALRTALSSKLKDQKLIVVDSVAMGVTKTKEIEAKLKALGWSNPLIIDGAAVDANFLKAVRNLKGVDVLPSVGANVYDILNHQELVLTKDAVAALEARLS
jgi:large subunit ribosomal protein L4